MRKSLMQKRRPAPRRAAGEYEKRGRFWAVTDAAGRLVCLAVYKKGAQEVLRRLTPPGHTPEAATETEPTTRKNTRRNGTRD
jgi:hypothetical protein